MDRRGNHAVELALILPIFLALLTGVFDYGWLMLHRQLAADAAQTGARAGAMAGEEEDADMVAAAAAAQRWSALQLPNEAQVVVSSTTEHVEVTLLLPDVRPVGLVPGPPGLWVTRSWHREVLP